MASGGNIVIIDENGHQTDANITHNDPDFNTVIVIFFKLFSDKKDCERHCTRLACGALTGGPVELHKM